MPTNDNIGTFDLDSLKEKVGLNDSGKFLFIEEGKKSIDTILSRTEIERLIFEESIIKIPEIFGSKLEFSFICGGMANGYWENTHDIDFFICLNGTMTHDEEIKYLSWYFDIHKKYGLTPDMDYPGEIIEKDLLIKTFGILHNMRLELIVTEVSQKKAIIWCDMLTSNIEAISGNNLELLELLRDRYGNEPEKWKEQLLNLIPENEVEQWKEKSHTLIMEKYMVYPKGDGRTKRESGYFNVPNQYLNDPVISAERFEPISWCKDINTQVELIKEAYPNLNINQEYLNNRFKKPIIRGTNRVVLPKIDFLAREYGIIDGYTNIGLLIEKTTELLESSRPFTNYRKGKLTLNQVIIDEKTALKRKDFESGIEGDILVLDVNLGTDYVGYSPRRARADINSCNDKIALTSSDIALILLFNEDRIQSDIDLSIDSVAETYFSDTRGWTSGLFYYFRKSNGELSNPVRNLEFGYRWNKRAYSDCGTGYFYIN